jgi:hypothetical protein
MVHFLRNKENRTIIECEVYNDDLSSSVDIREYTKMFLLLLDNTFMESIAELDEIRGWWWEQAKDSGEYKTIDEFVKEKYLWVAKEFDLNYVTD